ncbi:MAG TPA: DUF1707 domain-containing protein [Actinopolymorphaceae bacterium]
MSDTGKGDTGREAELRVSDQDRDRIVELLGVHAAAGRLTLAEHEERVSRALAARTQGELDALTRDLPVEARQQPRARRKISRWLVSIMSGSDRRGRFRISGTVNAVAIMGGDNIDLRNAEIDGDEVVVNLVAIMGGSDIYVPDTVEVVLETYGLMGGDEERGSVRPARPGAPVIRIRSFALMGGNTIWRLPADANELGFREARRVAKALERKDSSRRRDWEDDDDDW